MAAVRTANIVTRASLLASWHAAERTAEPFKLVVNHASAAGQLLEHAGGDVVLALTMLPYYPNPFWDAVRACLERAQREEYAVAIAPTEPPIEGE